MQLGEHLNGFLGGCLMAVNGNGGIDNLLHALTDVPCILKCHGMSDVEINIIAIGDGNVNGYLTRCVEVVDGFTQDEEQRAGVGAQASGGGDVEEFDVLGFVHTIVHAFYFVVDAGVDRTVRKVDAGFLVNLFQGASQGHFQRLSCIDTADIYSLFHVDIG